MDERKMTEMFEKWWRVAVISDVTGEVDHALWPNIDKDDSLCIWADSWKFATLAAEARIRDLEADAKRYSKLREIVSKGDLVGTDDRNEFDHWVDTMIRADAALTEHKEQP